MDQDDPGEAMAELKERHIGGLGVLQVAAGTGLFAYTFWAAFLMPGFRKVPLKLQVLAAYRQGFSPVVGYELNPWLLRLSRFHAWWAGCAQNVSYQKKDLWKVNLADCKNITVFLAPSVLPLLETKLLAELPNEARVVSGRFPLPSWEPTATVGEGLDKVWAYDIGHIRQNMEMRTTPFQGTPV